MRIVPSSASSEHWLTLMTCIVCSKTPDNSPVYKCNMGHTVCFCCFQKLVNDGIPICIECSSDKFVRVDVSSDFLRKLKNKPGIGRPCRYGKELCTENTVRLHTTEEPSITLEKLFQMDTAKLQQLFDQNTVERLRALNSYTLAHYSGTTASSSKCTLKNEKRDEEISVQSLADESSKVWLKKGSVESKLNFEGTSSHSRKPLKCPHDPCNKIIAVSSFQSHFKYEHSDFRRFAVERGKEVVLDFDPTIVKHENSLCLGIIQLYSGIRKNGTRAPIDTFWLMVSGSPADRKDQSFALFWLFTNNDDSYKCTVELCSKHDLATVTAFCGVNAIHQSQHISDIAARHNCLCAYRGAIEAMMDYDPILKLRIVIH